jgi:hypothetical protein
MRIRESIAKNPEALLIIGVVLIIISLPYLVGGLYGYFWIIPQERDDISEEAQEAGIGYIPGVSTLDSEASFFALNAVIGFVVAVIGVIVTAISLPSALKK